MNPPHTVNARLRNPETRDETLLEIADWVRDTCLFFGTSAPLAYQLAALFISGLAREVKPEGEE